MRGASTIKLRTPADYDAEGISCRNCSRSSLVPQPPDTRPHFRHSITYGCCRAYCFSASLITCPEQRPQINSLPSAVARAVNPILVIHASLIFRVQEWQWNCIRHLQFGHGFGDE